MIAAHREAGVGRHPIDPSVQHALAEWRDCLRRLDEMPPDADDRIGLASEVDRLRGEYQRLFDTAAEAAGDLAELPDVMLHRHGR